MEDFGDEVGPWDTRLPSLTFQLKVRPRKGGRQMRASPVKMWKKPETRVGFFVPPMHLMDCFNMTFIPRKTTKSVRRPTNPSPEPRLLPKPFPSPVIRSKSVMRSHKRRFPSPKQVSGELGTGGGSPRLGMKTLQQELTPINLALHLEPEYVRAGPKVLAGRFQHPSFTSSLNTDPALDALETRLTVLLQGTDHRRFLSQ